MMTFAYKELFLLEVKIIASQWCSIQDFPI